MPLPGAGNPARGGAGQDACAPPHTGALTYPTPLELYPTLGERLPAPGLQVNYFPSRFDPVRHAERFPENRMPVSGPRERRMIEKENNFQQPGDRFRGWDAARQDRFITRLVEFLAESRCTQVLPGPLARQQSAETRPACLEPLFCGGVCRVLLRLGTARRKYKAGLHASSPLVCPWLLESFAESYHTQVLPEPAS